MPTLVGISPAQIEQLIAAQKAQNHQQEPSPDWWLIGLTGLLAVSTLGLWKATRDLVLGAEKTAERQLRAYLTVGPIEFDPPSISAGGLRALYEIHNTGQTPAYKVKPVFRLAVLPVDFDPRTVLPLDIRTQEGVKGTATIGAQRPLHGTQGAQLGEEDLNAIKRVEKRLYLYCTVWYQDVFKADRRTDFSCIVRPEGNVWTTRITEHGNEAT